MLKNRQYSERLTGAVVPVGALRGGNGMGVGEYLDLEEFADLCKKAGLALIQLLPVNDTGYESSPYSSLTAFALHPLYIRIEEIEEYKQSASDTVKQKIAELRSAFEKEIRYPYYRILRAKMEILREIYTAHYESIEKKARPGGGLALWMEENPWIKEYAVFRRFKEVNGEKKWQEWSSHVQIGAADIEAVWADGKLRREHLFWAWLQETLDAQFSRAARAVAAMGILLMGDLPILMNEDSCDVWAHPEIFHKELSAGAPPDMYSPEGQNWGFPIYDWQAQMKDNYAWWKARLKAAEKYYQAYRIDHVLGFFRIWASARSDYSSALGRFIPYTPVTTEDLANLGFDEGRIQWMTRPHIPTGEVWDAVRDNWGNLYGEEEIAAAVEKVFVSALDRIGNEELWLFKEKIQGEKDIDALGLHPSARSFLFNAWHNRIFLEYEKDRYFPVWYYRYSRAYASLEEGERSRLEILLEKRRAESEKIWEDHGQKLLAVLTANSSMLPCAEDLGAVPACVPRVLEKLSILGLRVVRWFRKWDEEGQPYIHFEDYPELSICTPAVHDSSTVREWWEQEADQEAFAGFIGFPSLPRVYNPGTAKIILHKTASACSRFRVFQIQDLLHLSPKWYAADPASERINVPGSYNEFNWTYRLPAPIGDISGDDDFIKAVEELCTVKPAQKKKT
ncbi:MAG: 4-alpha-glucanotransferase [Treponema sp.]|jgi:4-alpha-glucanotransferase|nr:4-alpha-glucanotransferase [Treponema sp.]